MPKSPSDKIKKQIAATRRSLKTLDLSLRQLALMVAAGSKNDRPRRSRLSPKGRASLKLQGRYMGYMRQLKPKQKAQVRKIKKTKGVRAAIGRAKGFAQR